MHARVGNIANVDSFLQFQRTTEFSFRNSFFFQKYMFYKGPKKRENDLNFNTSDHLVR